MNYHKRRPLIKPTEGIVTGSFQKSNPYQMLSVKQVSVKLNVCTRTIYRYIKDGKLKAVKLGYIWRIREEDFEEFIKPK